MESSTQAEVSQPHQPQQQPIQEEIDQSSNHDGRVAPEVSGNTSTTTLNNQQPSHHAHFNQNEKPDAPKHHDNDENWILTEEDCYDQLGYCFPSWKKWSILSVIFIVQVSMNFNTSLYSNGLGGISKEFGISEQAARCGAMIFLVAYAFGCEFWAPFSEELGRRSVLQMSLFFVNLWQLPVALSKNFATVLVGRFLGGLSSAGGSVTLGMVADLWESDDQQYAVAFVVFSSVGGSVVGPIVGGFVEQHLSWRWCIWLQLIFGGAVQLLHLVLVPETRTTVMMDRIAKKWRESGDPQYKNCYGPNELEKFSERFAMKEVAIIWWRPFKMFLTEPIVLVLSLLSGFSDALIFMFIQSFSLVYTQWGFNPSENGLAFVSIFVGYLIAYISFIPAIRRNEKERRDFPQDDRKQYESRLWWLLYTAPCLPLGLIGFAWTCTGPPLPWIASMIFAAIVGIANYAIYMATIDYMICAYGPYSASATGGNGWSRDFLAGVLTIPATPFFTNLSPDPRRALALASTILFCISFILVAAVYIIYWKGPILRKRSPFAQQLADKSAGVPNDQARGPNVLSSKKHITPRPVTKNTSGLLGGGEVRLLRNKLKEKTAKIVAAVEHTNEKEEDAEGSKTTTGAPLRPISTNARKSSYARSQQDVRIRQKMGSRQHSQGTPRGTPGHSRAGSRRNSLEHGAAFKGKTEQTQVLGEKDGSAV